MPMAFTLPTNNGCTQVLTIERISTKSMREMIAEGVLEELEFGLLKGGSGLRSSVDKALGWGIEEKAVILNMEMDTLKARQGEFDVDIHVRSLCFSRGVTADYLKIYERFNMKHCVLALGDMGRGTTTWSELVQPAVFLHRTEFNILWVEIEKFKSNPLMWTKFGAELIRAILRFFCVKHVSVVARGVGGAVFLEALAKAPDLFGRTHFVYNLDMPPGKSVQLPVFDLEEVLRKNEMQLWFAFRDDDKYDRHEPNTGPNKAYDAIQKMQQRLLGERQRGGGRAINYDEVLITENLNQSARSPNVNQVKIGPNPILVFSSQLLESLSRYLEIAPGARQDSMEGGLVGDFRVSDEMKALSNLPEGDKNEPLAVRRVRVGHLHGLQDRRERARGNRKRLELVNEAADELLRPALEDYRNTEYPGFAQGLTKRLEDLGGRYPGSQGSGSGSRLGTNSPPRRATNSIPGSRLSTNSPRRQPGSRMSTNSPRRQPLPALRGSASAPSLSKELAPARMMRGSKESVTFALNDDDSEEEEEGLLEGIMGPKTAGLPWQQYRNHWQMLHGKSAPGFTHPMDNY